MSELLPFLPGFFAAFSILLVAASSPGPAVAMLLGISMSRGRSAALVTCLGIACGSSLINLATMLGVGLVLSKAAWAMQILRLLGAAYLAWLAYGAFRKAVNPPALHEGPVPARSAARLFAAGFALQVTNPKAIVFWLAISALGATHGGGALVYAAFFAACWLISFACHAAWALLLSSAPVRTAYARARRSVEATLGVLFSVFAFKLATSR
ncbi:MAG: LysE family translocator [Vannielia sp.]|uniref:LysE family translocator n=1 Tax=Rhodobacterales TaxID=204455 RepID=UPI0020956A42|nr:LysE family translocator [Oceanicola sp. 502str15]MCO6383791.1 LysE family transporter [Oceanicola sp. 502str15]